MASSPQEWIGRESPFTFVTEGVASAVELAQRVAGGKTVAVGGSKIAQQCLQAGLLGAGIPLFADVAIGTLELQCVKVIDTPGVTHLRYRIVK